MAIYSGAHERNPVVTSGILAEAALDALDAVEANRARDEFTAVTVNLLRLLEMYRVGRFSPCTSRGGFSHRVSRADLKARSRQRQALARVRDALEAAHAEVFGDISRSDLLNNVGHVLKLFASADTRPDIPPDDFDRTRRFVRVLSEQLRQRAE